MTKRKYIMTGMRWALFFCVFLIVPGQALADPPQNLALRFDAKNQILTVNIAHASTFTSLHYIKRVTVMKNNQEIKKTEYTSQPDKTSFSYTYQIPAAENDVLEVTAACNIQGSKTATLKVEAPKN